MTAKHTHSQVVHRYKIIYKPTISKKTKDIISDYWNNIDGYFFYRFDSLLIKYSITRSKLSKLVRESADCVVTEICSECKCDYERKAKTKQYLYLPVKEIRLCDSCKLIKDREREASAEKQSQELTNLLEKLEKDKETPLNNEEKIHYGDFIVTFSIDNWGDPCLLISTTNRMQFSVNILAKDYIEITNTNM